MKGPGRASRYLLNFLFLFKIKLGISGTATNSTISTYFRCTINLSSLNMWVYKWLRLNDTVFCLVLKEPVMMSQWPSVCDIKEYMIPYFDNRAKIWKFRGWGDGSFGKILAEQAWRPDVRDSAFSKKLGMMMHTIIIIIFIITIIIVCVHNKYMWVPTCHSALWKSENNFIGSVRWLIRYRYLPHKPDFGFLEPTWSAKEKIDLNSCFSQINWLLC